MCGICGVVEFTGAPVREEVLTAMAARLRHRGPDAVGVARPLARAGLGHTRLKVIDLSPAAGQPMASRDGRVWLVYNGEVYNYRALRAELEGHGRRFASQSDTEVILQAYEQWGEACIARLDGMFALAMLDMRRQQLLLARDRTGKKPLYYYHDRRRFVFASELKALLVHPEVPCEFHVPVLPLYLTYGYVPAPETFYRGIVSVPPATHCRLDLAAGSFTQQRYWELPLPGRARPPSQAEAAHAVRERMTAAVSKRLVADVPLGAFLSGGIDSTIVVGLMSRLLPQPVHTFSIGFRGDARYDETAYARIAARHFQTRHTEFVVEPKAFELLERLVYHHDQPFGDASAIPTYLLCQLAREHVTVALNGDGGDECFAGYRRFQAAVLSTYLPRWLCGGVASAMDGWLQGAKRLHPRVGEFARFCRAARRPWDERLVRWVSYIAEPLQWLHPDVRSGMAADAWLEPARRALASVGRASPLTQALYFNFQEYLPNDLHVKMDRCSMAHGLETRSPFLDTAVVEHAFGLPDAFKLRGGRTKAILKDAFAELLPPVIRQRGKWGFGVPLDAWFRADLRTTVQEVLLAPQAHLARYLDVGRVRAACLAHMEGRDNCGLLLWNLVTFEVWLQMCARRVWTDGSADAPTAGGIASVDVVQPP